MKKAFTALALTLLLLLPALPLTAGAAALPFSDVAPEDDAYPAIQYLYAHSLITGTDDSHFSPEEGVTRAMLVTVLGRMEGVYPDDYTGSPFSDVSAKTMGWAAPYIQWAAENSIVNGTGNGLFSPDTVITREQYCAIIQRYFISMEGKINANPPVFVSLKDEGNVSRYAKDSVRSLVGYGLIDPAADGTFQPKTPMTRGEIAQTFARVHALRTTDSIPQSLLSENTPYWLLFGVPAGEVGEFTVLEGWEPIYTPEDYYFTITQTGCVSTGFHSGTSSTDFLTTVDISRTGVYTTRGISLGSTRAEVQAAYPTHLQAKELSPFTGDYLWYNDQTGEIGLGWNLFFWFENDRVSSILAYFLED